MPVREHWGVTFEEIMFEDDPAPVEDTGPETILVKDGK